MSSSSTRSLQHRQGSGQDPLGPVAGGLDEDRRYRRAAGLRDTSAGWPGTASALDGPSPRALHTCATDPRRFRNTPPPVLQRQDCPSTRICTQSTSAPRPQVGLCSWTTLETTDASGAPTSAMPSSPNVVAGSTLLLVCVTRSMKSSYALCRSFSARAESNCIRGPSATLSRDIDSCYPLLDVLWS